MNSKIVLYENNEQLQFKTFDEIITKLKQKLHELQLDNYSVSYINSELNDFVKETLDELIKEKDLIYINVAFVNKITSTWINNITNTTKYELDQIDMYYNFNDIIFYYFNKQLTEDCFKITCCDGDEAVDIILNLIFIHILIKQIIVFISNEFERYTTCLFTILKNFRVGIYVCVDFEALYFNRVTYEFTNDLYLFFISYDNFNIKYFYNNELDKEIELNLPWIISILEKYIKSYTNIDFEFIPTILNKINKIEFYEIVENDFNFYFNDMKKFKNIIYNLSLNNVCPNSNININKRIMKTNERKTRNSKKT